uniref:Uncharacterized protein n=1 Tax=Anguilla anguilla TaxID=7936 RepID=A0A0E9TP62_ANGAN
MTLLQAKSTNFPKEFL